MVQSPSLFSVTLTLSPSMIATQEFVIPQVDADDLCHVLFL